MAIDRAAARAAGYTDAEIDAYEAEEKKKQPEPQMDATGDQPPPPPPANADQGEASSPGFGEVASTLVAAATPYALPATGIAAGLYGAAKVGGWGTNLAQSARDVASAMKERTAVEAARESRMANRPGFGGAPAAGTPPATRQHLQQHQHNQVRLLHKQHLHKHLHNRQDAVLFKQVWTTPIVSDKPQWTEL